MTSSVIFLMTSFSYGGDNVTWLTTHPEASILGVRTFNPRPVAELICSVGGTTTLLGLVAMASDVEMLYAAVKALSCVLKQSFSARQDMERIKGYQVSAKHITLIVKQRPGDLKWRERTETSCQIENHFSIKTTEICFISVSNLCQSYSSCS